jgi:hypothetical protein
MTRRWHFVVRGTLVIALALQLVIEHRLRNELAAQRRTIEHEMEIIETQNKTLERATRLIDVLRAACGTPAEYVRYEYGSER